VHVSAKPSLMAKMRLSPLAPLFISYSPYIDDQKGHSLN
jgi:hypothetical protein